MKKCVVIFNPESGKKTKKKNLLEMINDTLNKHDYECEIIPTTKKGDAYDIIKTLKKPDLVISAGGDGTLNEVISGNLSRKDKLLLAPLPIGTTNDVGSMYGFTKNIKNDLESILNGVEKEIDVCLINEKPFLYVACIGSFVNVTYETPRIMKKRYGKVAYILYGMKQLSKSMNKYNIKYKIDGKTYEGEYSFIFITNTSRVAGVNNIYTDVKLDDKKFEVALCSITNKAELVKTLFDVRNKEISTIKGIDYYRTDNIEIICDIIPESSWCLDGEEYKHHTDTFKFEISRGTKMLVPKKNLYKLFD